MGLFGGDDKERKRARPPYPYMVMPDNTQNQQPQMQGVPWQQALKQAQQNRSNFFNNISGQSWNVGKAKYKEHLRRRRPI